MEEEDWDDFTSFSNTPVTTETPLAEDPSSKQDARDTAAQADPEASSAVGNGFAPFDVADMDLKTISFTESSKADSAPLSHEALLCEVVGSDFSNRPDVVVKDIDATPATMNGASTDERIIAANTVDLRADTNELDHSEPGTVATEEVQVIQEPPAAATNYSHAAVDPFEDVFVEAAHASSGPAEEVLAYLGAGDEQLLGAGEAAATTEPSTGAEEQVSQFALPNEDTSSLVSSSTAGVAQRDDVNPLSATSVADSAPLSLAPLSPAHANGSEGAIMSAPMTASPIKDDPFAFLDEELSVSATVPGLAFSPGVDPVSAVEETISRDAPESFPAVTETAVGPVDAISVNASTVCNGSVVEVKTPTSVSSEPAAAVGEEEDPLAFLDSPAGGTPQLPPATVAPAGAEPVEDDTSPAEAVDGAAPEPRPEDAATTEGTAASEDVEQALSIPQLATTLSEAPSDGSTVGDGPGNDIARVDVSHPSPSSEGALEEPIATDEAASANSGKFSDGVLAVSDSISGHIVGKGLSVPAALPHNSAVDEDPFAALDNPSADPVPSVVTTTTSTATAPSAPATEPIAEASYATLQDPSLAEPALGGDDEWDDFAAPSTVAVTADEGPSPQDLAQRQVPADPPAEVVALAASDSAQTLLANDEEGASAPLDSPEVEPQALAAAGSSGTPGVPEVGATDSTADTAAAVSDADAAPLSAALSAMEEDGAAVDSNSAATEPTQELEAAFDAADDGDEWDDFAAPTLPTVAGVATYGVSGADVDALVATATAAADGAPITEPGTAAAMTPVREEEDPFAILDSPHGEAPPATTDAAPADEDSPESVAEAPVAPTEVRGSESALSVIADVEPTSEEALQQVTAGATAAAVDDDDDEWDDFAAPAQPTAAAATPVADPTDTTPPQPDALPSEGVQQASSEHMSADPEEWDDFAAPADPTVEPGAPLGGAMGAATEASLREANVQDTANVEPQDGPAASAISTVDDAVNEAATGAAAVAEGGDEEDEFGDFGDFEQPVAPASFAAPAAVAVEATAMAGDGFDLGGGAGQDADDDEWAAFEGPSTTVPPAGAAETPTTVDPAETAPTFAASFEGAGAGGPNGTTEAVGTEAEDDDEWDAFEGPAEAQASDSTGAFGVFTAPSEFSAPTFEASFDSAPAQGASSFAAFEGAAPGDPAASSVPAASNGFAAFDSTPAAGSDAFGAGGFAAFTGSEQHPSQRHATAPPSTPSPEFLSPLALQQLQHAEAGSVSSMKFIQQLPGAVFTEDQAKSYAALSALSLSIFGTPSSSQQPGDSRYLVDLQAQGALGQPLTVLQKDAAVSLHSSAAQPLSADSSASLRLPGEMERLLLDHAPADALSLEDLAVLLDSIEARKALRTKARTAAPAAPAPLRAHGHGGGLPSKTTALPSSGDRKRLSLDSSVLPNTASEQPAGGSSPMDFFFGRRASTTAAVTSSGSLHRPVPAPQPSATAATAAATHAQTAAPSNASALPPRPAPQRKSSFQTLTATLSAAVSGAAPGPSAGSSTASSAAPTPPPPALAALTEEAVRARQEEGYYGDSNDNLSPAALAFLQKLPDLSYLLS